MLCPDCGNKTKVIDSRTDGKCVLRRRKCVKCGLVFFTSESIERSGEAFHKLFNLYQNRRKYYNP